MIGEYFFHQSDSDPDQLKLSWKLYKDLVITEDVNYLSLDQQKKKILIVNNLEFDTEEELVYQYCAKYANSILDVYNSIKFVDFKSMDQMKEYLKYERCIRRNKVAYCLTIFREYLKNVIISYIKPNNRLVTEFIQILREGFSFHGKSFSSISSL